MSGEPLDLDALAALDQAATLGPWEAQEGAFGDPANGPDHMRVLREGWCTAYDVEHTVARLEGSQVGAADAALIAAARNALPALIAAARDLRDELHQETVGRQQAADALMRVLNVDDLPATGDLLVDMAAWARRLRDREAAARAEVAALRERVELLRQFAYERRRMYEQGGETVGAANAYRWAEEALAAALVETERGDRG